MGWVACMYAADWSTACARTVHCGVSVIITAISQLLSQVVTNHSGGQSNVVNTSRGCPVTAARYDAARQGELAAELLIDREAVVRMRQTT